MNIGAVIIGRNEGERLKRCIETVSKGASLVYVDSGSTDGSAPWARAHGADVIELDMSIPFTAARARNAGFRRLKDIAPQLLYVQFVDGDCELQGGWVERAVSFLDSHADVGVVCGRRRERHPERSIYNWLCDREWERPTGEVYACGGDAMMRTGALEAVGGFRDDVIAGEEPELCVRLRAAGYRIWRLGLEMTLHDAAMTRFGQWWRRAQRSGYGLAQCAYLHRATPQPNWAWELRRAWLWAVWLPLVCLVVGVAFGPWGWAVLLIFPLQMLRQTIRNRGPVKQRAILALFQLLARFPESFGQLKFMRDRVLGRQARLIEYK
jgi:GT2 family glycosyltransferase